VLYISICMAFHDLYDPRDWITQAEAPEERSWRTAELVAGGADGEVFRRVIASTEAVRTAVLRLPAGYEVVEHRHERSDEVFVIVGGTATFAVAGESIEVAPGDVVFAKGGERHGIKVGPDPLDLVLAVAPNLDDAEPH
jgi:quercetin dioxygenase-like cupin family protein